MDMRQLFGDGAIAAPSDLNNMMGNIENNWGTFGHSTKNG